MMRRVPWNLLDILLCYGGAMLSLNLLVWGVELAFPEWLAAFGSAYPDRLFLVSFFLQLGLLLGLIYLLLIRRRGARWGDLGLVPTSLSTGLRWGVGGGLLLTVLMLVFSYLLSFLEPNLGAQGIESALLEAEGGATRAGLILAAALLSPFYEEIFFRGVVYNWLRSHCSVFPACLGAGAFFALLHFDAWRFLPIAAGGAILSYLFERSGSLYVTILAHALWNSIMVLAVLAPFML
jgi:membrane protease YdiL (CAAX protease family)